MVRTSAQHAVGGYRKSLPHSADMELWLRFATHGAVAHIDALQAFKRTHTDNMQHQYLKTVLGDVKERQETFDVFFREDGRRLAGHEGLYGRARRCLAEQAFWAASQAFDAGDEENCQRFLDYAVSLDPQIRSQRVWSRLRWKRRLGRRFWGLLRPLVEGFRGSNNAAAARPPG